VMSIGPGAGGAGEGPGLVEGEPDVAVVGLAEFAEGVERHYAAAGATGSCNGLD
jgi:hypothetical protein